MLQHGDKELTAAHVTAAPCQPLPMRRPHRLAPPARRADCCDGSDEPAARCPDTCYDKGMESLVALKDQVGAGTGHP